MIGVRRMGRAAGFAGLPFIIMVAVVAAPRMLPFVSVIESWLADFRIAWLTPAQPQRDDIVILGIDENTLAEMHYRSPVDRGHLARWLESLEAAGVRAVGFDMLFDQQTDPAKDALFERAVAGATVPVVVGWAGRSDGLTDRQIAFQRDYLPGVAKANVKLLKDRLGTARWIPRPIGDDDAEPGAARLGFAPAILDVLGLPAPAGQFEIAYRGPARDGMPGFKIYPAHTAANLPKKWLEGRIVLIGATLPQSDRHRTPFTVGRGNAPTMPGVLIHAHVVAQLVDGRQLARPRLALEAVIAAGLALVGLILAVWSAPAALRGALAAVTAAGFWIAGFALFQHGGPLIPLLAPTIGLGAAYGVVSAYVGSRFRREKKQIRKAFTHYVAPAVVKHLEDDPRRLQLGGEWREVTYIFTDIAGFTTLSESMEPKRLVPMLNDYLDGMSRIVLKHEGTIDKFIGDAVVALFGAPDDQPDHARRAIACALELDAFAQGFAQRQAAQGVAFGITRIGVHTGPAIVGNIGGKDRFDYTAIGDTVNTAARLEGANKYLGTRICVGGATAAVCDGVPLRPVGDVVLKGKTECVPVFEPLSAERAEDDAITAYLAAFEKLRNGDSSALEAFEMLLATHPDDALAAFYLARLSAGERGIRIELTEK